MRVGDLIKHIDFEKYGIITEIVEFHSHASLYYVVLWHCGNRSGQYGKLLETVCK
jgi:hypothetical protein